ncbi:MAG: hypothetical protein ACRYF0_07585 [Janthinobacterium lividum]
MRPLLSLPQLQLSLHEGPVPVLELQWLQYAPSAEFRAASLQALQLSQQHQVKGWVADDRLQGAIRPRDLEWAEQEVLLPLDQLGLTRFAQLEAQDALNRHTVNNLFTRATPVLHFALRRFDDLAQARTWASGGGA